MSLYTVVYLIVAILTFLSNSPMRRIVVKLAIIIGKGSVIVAWLAPKYAAQWAAPKVNAARQKTMRILEGFAYANLVLFLLLIFALITGRHRISAGLSAIFAIEATVLLQLIRNLTRARAVRRRKWLRSVISPADAYGIAMIALLFAFLGVVELTFPALMTGMWAKLMALVSLIALMFFIMGVLQNKHTITPHWTVTWSAVTLVVMMVLYQMLPWSTNAQLGSVAAVNRSLADWFSTATFGLSEKIAPVTVPEADQLQDNFTQDQINGEIAKVNLFLKSSCGHPQIDSLPTEDQKAIRREECSDKIAALNKFKRDLKELRDKSAAKYSPTPNPGASPVGGITTTVTAATPAAVTDVTIPFRNYSGFGWDGYGPGIDKPTSPGGAHLWMSQRGTITYTLNLPAQPTTNATLTVRLSSELKKMTSADPNLGSDVMLIVNGEEIDSKSVIADNLIGADYKWTIKSSKLNPGDNSITFQVGGGSLSNGLAIYSDIRFTFK